jgi:hypothetical protein
LSSRTAWATEPDHVKKEKKKKKKMELEVSQAVLRLYNKNKALSSNLKTTKN